MSTFQDAANKGAALLDRIEPDWLDLVSLDLLDMGLTDMAAIEHGFSVDFSGDRNYHHHFEDLTDIWRQLITDRRKERTMTLDSSLPLSVNYADDSPSSSPEYNRTPINMQENDAPVVIKMLDGSEIHVYADGTVERVEMVRTVTKLTSSMF